MQDDYLKSIKSRMGWQIAAQVGTLLAISGLNSSVREQTEYITAELNEIKNVNVEGFNDVTSAINSLEASLLSGFEDIKWFLGSIDDKLARLIGLVEYPKSTESTEQYKFGFELYKQKMYDKAIISFNNSISNNPLNLNAKVGLYLSVKANTEKPNLSILDEIIRLTDSNFLMHLDVTDEIKQNSILYFSKFVFNELAEYEDYEKIVTYYENELIATARDEISMKIKYIGAKILLEQSYKDDVEKLIDQGNLKQLLCFINYKEDDRFVDFIQLCTSYLQTKLSEFVGFKNINNKIDIAVKAAHLSELLEKNNNLIDFGCVPLNISAKLSYLRTFFNEAKNSESHYKNHLASLDTNKKNIVKVEAVINPVCKPPTNQFLTAAFNDIFEEFNLSIVSFKSNEAREIKTKIKSLSTIIKQYENGYPLSNSDEYENFIIVFKILSKIDLNASKFKFDDAVNNNIDIDVFKKLKDIDEYISFIYVSDFKDWSKDDLKTFYKGLQIHVERGDSRILVKYEKLFNFKNNNVFKYIERLIAEK